MINTLTTGIIETIYMVFVSMIVTYVFGLPLGVILFVTDKGSLYPNRIVNLILGFLVNVFRSIPFLILLVLLFSQCINIPKLCIFYNYTTQR